MSSSLSSCSCTNSEKADRLMQPSSSPFASSAVIDSVVLIWLNVPPRWPRRNRTAPTGPRGRRGGHWENGGEVVAVSAQSRHPPVETSSLASIGSSIEEEEHDRNRLRTGLSGPDARV